MNQTEYASAAPHDSPQRSIVAHARTFASLTLVSRVFGLVRDAILARALGLSAVGTAFTIAFQIPNTFRRLFGEGALSAAFIPEYAQQVKHDPELAQRVASLTLGLLVLVVGVISVVIEVALLGLLAWPPARESAGPVLTLTAIMLPYMPLVCVTALLGGMLQVHGRFAPQAGAPIILNLGIIAAASIWGLVRGAEPMETALAVAVAVVLAGCAQVAWCAWALRGTVRWTRGVEGTRSAAVRIWKRMIPVIIGLGALQLSTLMDSLIAGYPVMFGSELPGIGPYPMDAGAGATLGFTQRLYQFPLGVFGIALATAAFPALSRQADETALFAVTLRRTLRLAAFIGVPATLGMALVARDATALVYGGHEITPDATVRMARVLVLYSPLIGVYSVIHVLTRAFYARGQTMTPTRIGLLTIGLGLVLNLVLMWPMAERGLALASSIAAVVQLGLLWLLIERSLGRDGVRLLDRATTTGLVRTLVMATVMALGLGALGRFWSHPEAGDGAGAHMVRLLVDIGIGGLIYGGMALVWARREIGWLLGRSERG